MNLLLVKRTRVAVPLLLVTMLTIWEVFQETAESHSKQPTTVDVARMMTESSSTLQILPQRQQVNPERNKEWEKA